MLKRLGYFIWLVILSVFYFVSSIFVFVWSAIKCLFKNDK